MPLQFSKSALFVAIIIVAAALSSIISFEYTTTNAEQIVNIASEDSRTNAKLQARDLSTLLTSQIESVAGSLETISAGKAVLNQDVSGAIPLLNAGQKSTNEFTSAYSWLDKDGRLLYSTSWASNATLRQQFEGLDLSFREYYSQPKQTTKPYYSTIFEGLDGTPRLSISYPIIASEDGSISESSTPTFRGIIVASMEVKTVGQFVQNQLSAEHRSSVGLLDRDGVVLYSSSSPQNVGKNVFDKGIQSAIPADIKERFNQFLRDSLNGNSGYGDFSSQGKTSTIAYAPVKALGNEFAVLYVVSPHELAASAVALIDQQKTLNFLTTAVIGSIAAGLASAVAIWNKRLDKQVATKTSELKFANESLVESNKLLQTSNTKLSEANLELAKAYEQLEIHDKLQNEFVNIAAHELRTPIQPLLGAAELIDTQFEGKEKIEVTKPEIEMILRNAKRLERLSMDILELSRIDSGAMKLNKERFSLAYIIANAVKDAKSQSNFDSEMLTITYSPDDIFIYADKEKITEVITNLLTNAIKFTTKGTISITTQRDKDNRFAEITVRDSGTGINPEIMPQLFGKFVTKSDKGTGIGLYISKKIVEAHGGTIVGQNNLDGPGATFRFSAPLAEDLEGKNDDVRPSSLSQSNL